MSRPYMPPCCRRAEKEYERAKAAPRIEVDEIKRRAMRIDTQGMLVDGVMVPMHQYIVALEESHADFLKYLGEHD